MGRELTRGADDFCLFLVDFLEIDNGTAERYTRFFDHPNFLLEALVLLGNLSSRRAQLDAGKQRKERVKDAKPIARSILGAALM